MRRRLVFRLIAGMMMAMFASPVLSTPVATTMTTSTELVAEVATVAETEAITEEIFEVISEEIKEETTEVTTEETTAEETEEASEEETEEITEEEIEEEIEEITEPEAEEAFDDTDEYISYSGNRWGIEEDDYNFILLANCVGHEAGSDWFSVEEKAKVVEVVLNRLESQNSDFYSQNSIYKVLTARNQFSGAWGYVDLGWYSSEVTSSCKEAVRRYLAGEFTNHDYLYFYGDSYANYFSVDYWG